MSNIVTCEGCGAQYDATGYQPGVQFACTNCGSMVTVPAPGIEFADQGPESAYDPGEAVAEAANAKLKAHGVRPGKKRPGHAGGKPSPQNRRPGGAPAKRGGQPKQRAQRPEPRGGRPDPRGARGPAKKAGGRGPAPKGRMANAGGRPAGRTPQRGRQHARDDYYDEEDDYDGFAPKKDNTMMIIGIVVGALIIIAVLAFVLMGDDTPTTDPGSTAGPEEEKDDYAQYRPYLNNEKVKEVVDKFIKAIENQDDPTFNSLIDWEKVAANGSKSVDLVKEYFNVASMNETFGFFDMKIDFQGKYDYYNKRIGRTDNVGYGMWHFTPTGEIGKEFDWIVVLELDHQALKWKIIQIGGMPDDVMGLKTVRLQVPNYDEEQWEFTKFYFSPEQLLQFNKHTAIDENYIPASSSEYTKKTIMKIKPFSEDDFEGPATSSVKVPELIKNVSASGDYSSKISDIKNGYLGSSREFSDADKNKDVVGELINIIIEGAKDGYKSKIAADAALEANSALRNIFGKSTGAAKIEFSFRISKMPGDEGEIVDEATMKEVVDVIKKWIDIYKQQGWTVE